MYMARPGQKLRVKGAQHRPTAAQERAPFDNLPGNAVRSVSRGEPVRHLDIGGTYFQAAPPEDIHAGDVLGAIQFGEPRNVLRKHDTGGQ